MEEIWKAVKGYEGLYEVSSFGNVRSLNWGGTGIVRNLYLKKHNRGYCQGELFNGMNRHMYLVHRLVADAFIPNPNGLPHINHIDENKRNNNVDNLEWCTPSTNMKKYVANHVGEFIPAWFKSDDRSHPRCRKPYRHTRPIMQTQKSGEFVKNWSCVNEIKHSLGYRDSHITDCCNGLRKSAYGFNWQYAD